MDNNNQTLPPSLVQPQSRRWYQHRGVIAIMVLAVVAAVLVCAYTMLHQPQDLEPIIINHHPKTVTQTNELPTPTTSPAQQTTVGVTPKIDTSSWKSYKDNSLGFQMQYPPDWTVQKSTYNSTGNAIVSIHFYPPGKTPGYEYQGDIIVDTVSNPKQLDLQTFYNQPDNSYGTGTLMTTITGYPEIKFSDIPAMIPSDQISVNLGKTIVELTDVGQQHTDDGITDAMANTISSNTSTSFRYLPIGEVLEWTKNTKWNFDPPNTYVTYNSTDKDFSFQVPYNANWGNDQIKLKPYEVTKDGSVYFGNVGVGCEGGCGMSRDEHVYTQAAQNADAVIADLNKNYWDGGFAQKPIKVNLGSLQVVEYEYGELGTQKYVIVIGKKFNYVFTADNFEIKDLEQVAKTVTFN